MTRKLLRLGGIRFYSDSVVFYEAVENGVAIWFQGQSTGRILKNVDIADVDDALLKIEQPLNIVEYHDAPRKGWFR